MMPTTVYDAFIAAFRAKATAAAAEDPRAARFCAGVVERLEEDRAQAIAERNQVVELPPPTGFEIGYDDA